MLLAGCRKCGKPGKRLCDSCRKLKDKKYFQAHVNEKSASATQRKRDILDWYRALKDMKNCARCGNAWPYPAMQYDHIPGRGKKLLEVSAMVRLGYEKEKIMAEIAKCTLLCACCHAMTTHERRINGGKVTTDY